MGKYTGMIFVTSGQNVNNKGYLLITHYNELSTNNPYFMILTMKIIKEKVKGK